MKPATGDYPDVPAFIYGITREIWEDRGVGGKLQKYYASDILLRAPTGLTTDSTGVTAQTLQTLHQFPDRQLVGEDVIWDAAADGSFLSSHRLISVMRHQGAGSYGAATNRVVRSRVIAECWVADQVVTEEWLVRDQSGFARCLGLDAETLARQMIEDDLRGGGEISFFRPEHDVPGVYRPRISTAAEAELYLRGYQRLWQDKETEAVRELYFHGACLQAPGGASFHGHADIDSFYIGYLASFPDASLQIHSAIVNRDPGRPVRVALRWSLRGTHTGFGTFGRPTGAPVHVMGLSHAEIFEGRIRAEWLLTDEVAIWKQILAHSR